jgi:hypothetical protein
MTRDGAQKKVAADPPKLTQSQLSEVDLTEARLDKSLMGSIYRRCNAFMLYDASAQS